METNYYVRYIAFGVISDQTGNLVIVPNQGDTVIIQGIAYEVTSRTFTLPTGRTTYIDVYLNQKVLE